MDSGPLIVIFLTLLFSAFFSGIEIAFISANKLRIELQNKQGVWSAKILSWYLKDPTRFISTTLIGNNISLVIYGIFSEVILNDLLQDVIVVEFWRFIVITIASTMLVLITVYHL